MNKNKQEKEYCRSCKYSSDYGNYMVYCEFQQYPVPASWTCNIKKYSKKTSK